MVDSHISMWVSESTCGSLHPTYKHMPTPHLRTHPHPPTDTHTHNTGILPQGPGQVCWVWCSDSLTGCVVAENTILSPSHFQLWDLIFSKLFTVEQSTHNSAVTGNRIIFSHSLVLCSCCGSSV